MARELELVLLMENECPFLHFPRERGILFGYKEISPFFRFLW